MAPALQRVGDEIQSKESGKGKPPVDVGEPQCGILNWNSPTWKVSLGNGCAAFLGPVQKPSSGISNMAVMQRKLEWLPNLIYLESNILLVTWQT
jgi:hypothetical protein